MLNDVELKTFWNALRDPSVLPAPARDPDAGHLRISRAMAIALQLCVLLLSRESEIAGMRIEELDFENATWTLPAERMKGGWPHVVPLPSLAILLIKEALALR